MKRLMGLFASVALVSSGMALANEEGQYQEKQRGAGMQQERSGQQQDASGGAGQQGTQMQGQQMGSMQLMGEVVEAKRGTIHVKQQNGPVVSLKVSRQTRFTGSEVKKAGDLEAGNQISATFTVKGTENIATLIEPADRAMGGAGGMMEPDTGINQQPQDEGLFEGGEQDTRPQQDDGIF